MSDAKFDYKKLIRSLRERANERNVFQSTDNIKQDSQIGRAHV